jgi:hypothetical protein
MSGPVHRVLVRPIRQFPNGDRTSLSASNTDSNPDNVDTISDYATLRESSSNIADTATDNNIANYTAADDDEALKPNRNSFESMSKGGKDNLKEESSVDVPANETSYQDYMDLVVAKLALPLHPDGYEHEREKHSVNMENDDDEQQMSEVVVEAQVRRSKRRIGEVKENVNKTPHSETDSNAIPDLLLPQSDDEGEKGKVTSDGQSVARNYGPDGQTVTEAPKTALEEGSRSDSLKEIHSLKEFQGSPNGTHSPNGTDSPNENGSPVKVSQYNQNAQVSGRKLLEESSGFQNTDTPSIDENNSPGDSSRKYVVVMSSEDKAGSAAEDARLPVESRGTRFLLPVFEDYATFSETNPADSKPKRRHKRIRKSEDESNYEAAASPVQRSQRSRRPRRLRSELNDKINGSNSTPSLPSGSRNKFQRVGNRNAKEAIDEAGSLNILRQSTRKRRSYSKDYNDEDELPLYVNKMRRHRSKRRDVLGGQTMMNTPSASSAEHDRNDEIFQNEDKSLSRHLRRARVKKLLDYIDEDEFSKDDGFPFFTDSGKRQRRQSFDVIADIVNEDDDMDIDDDDDDDIDEDNNIPVNPDDDTDAVDLDMFQRR